jgi:CTP synthase (UTP-ammonia lyase)
MNPEYVQALSSGSLRVVGTDLEGEVRVVELPQHSFYIGTLFLPQLNSSIERPHPLIVGFLKAFHKEKAVSINGLIRL